MRLKYKPEAIKQLKKLPGSEKKKVVRKLEVLALEPWSGKALRGEFRGWRSVKAWPYRIIYQIKDKTLTIYSVAHRQGVYK